MSDKRPNNQLELAFLAESRSEAPRTVREGTETLVKNGGTESPAITEQWMEEVVERENCKAALKQVKANKGGPGIDGMTVDELPGYLDRHWPAIREQLLSGTSKPQPVKRVEIPKPDGGVRKLGIPKASANCTGAKIAFRMGGNPPSLPSASRPALPGFESAPNSGY